METEVERVSWDLQVSMVHTSCLRETNAALKSFHPQRPVQLRLLGPNAKSLLLFRWGNWGSDPWNNLLNVTVIQWQSESYNQRSSCSQGRLVMFTQRPFCLSTVSPHLPSPGNLGWPWAPDPTSQRLQGLYEQMDHKAMLREACLFFF